MTGFLTLDDLLLPAPLPAVVAVLLAAGVWGLARGAARFVVLLGLLAALVNSLLMMHLAGLFVLRVLAALLVVTGVVTLPATFRVLVAAARVFLGQSLMERFVFGVAACIVGGLGLAALGPVTDPDSLDYHLGVPLEWLRSGGAISEPHWLHARLTGLGEALNTLGLAGGTDCLGAVLQVCGLLLVIAVVAQAGRTLRDRLFGLLLVLPPAILPLATSQKPQLLPAAALVVAMMLARTAESGSDFALVFGCAAFAVACKYSFVVSGGVVAVAALGWAYRRGRLRVAAAWAAVAFVVLVVPGMGRNLALYGDPVSPFLEAWRKQPDREVAEFARYLGIVGGEHTLAGAGHFLKSVVWPEGAGGGQTILGVGILVLLVLSGNGSVVAFAGFAAVLVFTLWQGQMAPRYLLEGYFWCAAAAAPWSRLKSLLFCGLAVQTAGVAVMALFAAGLLFPGALIPAWRDRVMRRATYGYAEARWVDRVVPKGATVMSESRAYALMPRPFRIPWCASCGSGAVMNLGRATPDVLVLGYPVAGQLAEGCYSTILAGPERLPYAARNPFNAREYQVVAMRVRCD